MSEMARCDKLIQKAQNNSAGLRFSELVQLAECYGFEHNRTTGSHHIFKHSVANRQLNLQPDKNGKAKEYQVLQVLKILKVIGPEEE